MSTKKIAFIVVTILMLSSLLLVIPTLAIHDLELFELDRNATDEGGVGDDWATLYGGGGSAIEFTGVIEDTTGTNPLGTSGTQFQAGGSKDDLDLSPGGATGQVWKWDPGEPLDKDDITNAYAAAYANTIDTGENNVGDLIIYFGLDRFANNGSAQVGFWFLQDPNFGLTTTSSGGGYLFSGHHVVGDVLVQSNFSQGGVIDSISVYEWVGSGGSNNTLNLLFTAQDCEDPGLADDPACATVNQGDTPAPWPFTPKFGTSGTFPQGSFFEGGINITRLVPDAGCFTGFLAETRSSTPFDSRLKDFAMGNFNLCSISVTKTGDTLSKIGDDVDYTVTIENTGAIKLYKDDISDSLLGAITTDGVDQTNSYVTANTCGAILSPGASCTISLTRTVQEGDPDPLDNTVSITYKGKSDLSGQAVSASDDHSVNLFQPAIAVDKTGDDLSKVGDVVNYTITLSNNSSDDTPAMNCTAEDTLLGTVFDGVLPLGDTVLTPSYTVQEGDQDPLINTVTLTCSPEGFPNVLEEFAIHSTNLFQPAIAVDKTGDELSKVGDDINYTITLSNNSSGDTPAMNCTAEDTLLGTLFDGVLPLGDTVITPSYTVQEGDQDPLVNTVTLTCSPEGFSNVLEESASHSTNLFQPAIAVAKTGDTLSKVGDDVNYTITLSNNSSADTPAMNCKAEDTLLGTVFDNVLPLGDTVLTPSRTVQAGDPDPLVNTVTLTCSPEGFPNVLEASASHSTNLFQPAIAIAKTGDDLSKVGDDVSYTITLSNNSSTDTPALSCTATDSLLGQVFNGVLPVGDKVIDKTYTVQAGDPDPLVNNVSMTCSVAGFPNVLNAGPASHSVNLFQPAIAVDKTGDALSKVGDDVNYEITLSNNSSADTPAMNCTAEDTLLGTIFDDVLPPGDTVLTPSRTVQAGDPDPLVNTVTLTCSPEGFPNVYDESASHSTNLFQPAIAVAKTGDELSKVGDDVNYTITLSNNSSADTPAMNCTANDSLLGAVFSGVLPAGDTVLHPSYTVKAGDPDPLVNTVTLTCTPAGYPNVINAGPASHSTNLFQPAVQVTKSGPDTAATGSTITYSFTINNLSSSDSPNLILDSVTDTVLGNLTATASANGCGSLAPGGSCSFTVDYTIQSSDPNPLVNVVTIHYHPDGFPNDITDDDSHQVEVQIPFLGCTPGFWQGGSGIKLWNQPPTDPQWPNDDTQPFYTQTLFNDYFNVTTDPRLDGLTMLDLVGSGGTSDSARRAARDMVAAYLNEAAFPDDFPADSLSALETMWYNAVAGGDSALDAFHNTVSGWNDPESPGYCPLP